MVCMAEKIAQLQLKWWVFAIGVGSCCFEVCGEGRWYTKKLGCNCVYSDRSTTFGFDYIMQNAWIMEWRVERCNWGGFIGSWWWSSDVIHAFSTRTQIFPHLNLYSAECNSLFVPREDASLPCTSLNLFWTLTCQVCLTLIIRSILASTKKSDILFRRRIECRFR